MDLKYHVTAGVFMIDSVTIEDEERNSHLNLIVPDTVDGDPVKKLCKASFAGLPEFMPLEEIVLPDSLTDIGDETFKAFPITKVRIPDSVSFIGDRAFEYCEHLTTVTWSEKCKIIPSKCFRGCSHLQSIENVSKVQMIEGYAFEGRYLRMSFPDFKSLKYIGVGAFMSNYFTSLPNLKSVTVVEDGAFSWASFDGKVNWFENCTIIPKSCFYKASMPSIVIPDSVTYIGSESFQECECLTSLHWPASCSIIADKTFYKCGDLECVSNLEHVTEIGSQAFMWTKLIQVHFRELKSIGSEAFYGSNLNGIAGLGITGLEHVTSIGSGAFAKCKIESIHWPDECPIVPDRCFLHCSRLKSVDNLSSVRIISSYSFTGTGIKEISFDDSLLEHIQNRAFDSDFDLSKIKVDCNTIIEK